MSGPKSSRYYMTAEERRRLQEQRRKEMEARLLEEKKNKEINAIRNECSKIEKLTGMMQISLSQIENVIKEGNLEQVDLKEYIEHINNSSAEMDSVQKVNSGNSLEELKKKKDKVVNATKTLEKDIKSLTRILEIQENKFNQVTIERISEGFNISFANISNRNSLANNEFVSKINKELDKISDVNINDQLSRRFEEIKQMANEIKSVEFLGNFYAITVVPFVRDCLEYNKMVNDIEEQYEDLYARYKYLSGELKLESVDIPISYEAIQILLSKISVLEEQLFKQEEESYIARCIDEAMQEMHYSVIGSRQVQKKSGKKFRNVLYKFDEGTAVNVTYSDDGQITMELGGLSNEDRAPTDLEGASLEKDMISFCDDYYLIEKKLKQKGIETNRISHLPPEAQFAQIINVEDYSMTEDIGAYEAKVTNRTGSSSATRVIRKEE